MMKRFRTLVEGDLTLDEDAILECRVTGSVTVPSGITLLLRGLIDKNLEVDAGGHATVREDGVVGGDVRARGIVDVAGTVRGNVVEIGGTVSWTDGALMQGLHFTEVDTEQQPITLVLDGQEYTPYRYMEMEMEDPPVVAICARLKLSLEEHSALLQILAEKESDSFTLLRKGVTEDPVQVGINPCVWSRIDDVVIYELRMVQQTGDKVPQRSKSHVPDQMEATQRELVYIREAFDRLLNLLTEKGVLSAEEAEVVDSRGETTLLARWRQWQRFMRVYDLDQAPFPYVDED